MDQAYDQRPHTAHEELRPDEGGQKTMADVTVDRLADKVYQLMIDEARLARVYGSRAPRGRKH